MPMTPEEIAIVRELGFDGTAAEFVRSQSSNPLERLKGFDADQNPQLLHGLSVKVKNGDEAERLMIAIRAQLDAAGYRAFWTRRRAPNGLRESDEVAILKTADPYEIVRLRQTSAGNYDITTEDILRRLAEWERICVFEVVGADSDWVAIQFSQLPEKICAFAEEVYAFCPDTVHQGTEMSRENKDPARIAAARLLCPEISVTKSKSEANFENNREGLTPERAEMVKQLMAAAAKDSMPLDVWIRLLALEIQERKYLFLWWD